jgi:hypothetical protein
MNLAFLVPAFRKNQKEASTITLLSLASALIDMGHKLLLFLIGKTIYPNMR